MTIQGRYLPVYASAVYENNKVLKAAGIEPINLKSVMIGNGVTDTYTLAFLQTSLYDLNLAILQHVFLQIRHRLHPGSDWRTRLRYPHVCTNENSCKFLSTSILFSLILADHLGGRHQDASNG